MNLVHASCPSYGACPTKLDLSGATLSGTITTLNNASTSTTINNFTIVIFSAGTALSGISFESHYTYAYSAASDGIVNVYVASGTTSVPELTDEVFASATRVNVSGDGATAYISTLTLEQQAKCVVPFSGYVEAIGGSVQTIVYTTVVTNHNAALTDVTSLKIVSGTVTDDDVTWITGYLTNMTTLDVSNATLTAEQIFTLMGMSSVTTLTLSEAQKASLKTLSDKTFTTAMLNKIGLSVNNLLKGMTTHNFIEGTNTLYVTGELTSDVLTTIKSKLNANSSITTLDVSRCTNSSGIVNITDSNLSTNVKVVSLPGNGYITYGGTQASALENGALMIKIGNGPGEYASIEVALSTNATLLGSGNVERVRISGALSTADLGKVHEFGSTYTGKVKTINLSEATLASGAVWTSLSGDFDFGNAGVLLPSNVTTGTLTNANVFYPSDNVLHATCNVTSTFNDQLEFFVSKTGKSIVVTNATNTTELLALAGVNTVINTVGATATVYGALTSDALSALSGLTTMTRIDLSNATYSGTTAANISIPSTLTSLVLPKNTEIDASTRTSLKNTASGLTYIYSPTSNNQTVAEQFVPDRVWVLVAGGLDDAVRTETVVQNAIYVKIASDDYLNAADLNLSGEIKATSDGQHGWQYCDFSESMLNSATVGDIEAGHSYSYRIILPNDVTADQMAAFSANAKVGSLAAVYSYSGTCLNIVEINDNAYSQNALTDSRIVRSGTTMINVESGMVGGSIYSSFGINLLAAINNAQAITSIKSVKIDTGSNIPNPLTFTNNNITSLDLTRVKLAYGAINVDACSSLQTLNLTGVNINTVDASVATLQTVILNDATFNGAVDFSGATALTTFTDNSETYFNSTLNLSQTGLTSFAPVSKIHGDISLNASSSLASINLLNAQFEDSYGNANTTSWIHIDENATEAEGNTTIIAALKVSESIKVPNGFSSSTRIHPYSEASSYIKEAASAASLCVFTNTDMTLHETEAAAGGDKLVYWYADGDHTNAVATVTLDNDRSTGRTLSEIITNNSLGTSHVKVKINGPMLAADVAALKNINATVLDLSDATSGETGENAKTIVELLADAFGTSGALNDNTKFLIVPDESTRENLINATNLAGLTNIWSVVATKPNNTAKDIANNDLGNGYDFTSYTKVPGTLQAATVHALASSTGDYTRTPNINGTPTSKSVYLSNISTFRDLKISGQVNAYDLCKSTTVDQNGHLQWNRSYTEAPIETEGYALVGQEVYGPFGACFNITSIDLEKATFESGHIADMTLSYLNNFSANSTRKVVIPTDPSVDEIPADFMTINGCQINSICIPYNIKKIRSRAFNTIDYIWTTSGTNDPEGSNTKLDNGAYVAMNSTTPEYATNWNTTKDVKADFDYVKSYLGGSYTFSANIELIESGAFANTQPHVKDVYVLNDVAPECHVDAFNTVMYLGNGGYSPLITEGIITRDSYQNGGEWITMLHYPRQTVTPNVQRYTDPTRSYSIATGYRDGKGNMLYFPNQSEFIRAYTQGTYGYTWNAWNPTRQYGSVNNGEFANVSLTSYNSGDQAKANTNFDAYTAGGDNHQYTSFYDLTSDGATSKPSSTVVDYYNIYWNESSYSTSGTAAQHLYPQKEISTDDLDSDGKITTKDYRGWHQFVLNAYAANTIVDEEPYRSFINDNDWWTICPTFDMSYADIVKIFGTEGASTIPYVSRLLYVRREYDPDNNNIIYLNFSDNLMLYKENRPSSATTDDPLMQHGVKDADGVVTISGTVSQTDIVMKAGVPYLIKPYLPSGDKRMFRVYTTSSWGALSDELKAQANAEVKVIIDTELYNRMHAAANQDGGKQMNLVENGKYTVPVFFKGTAASGITKESAVSGFTPTANFTGYEKSADWKYTFVGSFYQSYLPAYSYSLGKKNGKVSFLWNRVMDQNNMRWINETGIICPTKAEFTSTITRASAGEPAQWKLFTGSNNAKVSILNDDSFVVGSGSGARQYKMVFGSDDMSGEDVTGIHDLNDANSEMANDSSLKVYSLGGMYQGNSLNGLSKGVYIVNGKKFVVK